MEYIVNLFKDTSFAVANIKHSWKTTLLGLMLIVGGFVSKFVAIAGATVDWNGAIIPIIVGIILCFTGDSPNGSADSQKQTPITTE